MSDVLKIIRDLKERLWKLHGNVLLRTLTQDEKHLTYYLSDVLVMNGYKHEQIDGQTLYTEEACQRAFIAGLRLGVKEADARAEEIVQQRIDNAVAALRGEP